MWKDWPTYGALYEVSLSGFEQESIFLFSLFIFLIYVWVLGGLIRLLLNLSPKINFQYINFRYSNRVKAEAERMNQLELDELEVVPSLSLSHMLTHKDTGRHTLSLYSFLCCWSVYIMSKLQMDEEEKYNRKLEAGLYTLQVKD